MCLMWERCLCSIFIHLSRQGEQTKHTGNMISIYLKEIALPKNGLYSAHLFSAADRIRIFSAAVVSWGTQGDGLVSGRVSWYYQESDLVSSYVLAIQIKHLFHVPNTSSYTYP